jgi:hypothetical protein
MKEIDIVHRLDFDANRCRVQFSNGVASNIEAGIKEIERLRQALRDVMDAKNDPYEVARNALGLEVRHFKNAAGKDRTMVMKPGRLPDYR